MKYHAFDMRHAKLVHIMQEELEQGMFILLHVSLVDFQQLSRHGLSTLFLIRALSLGLFAKACHSLRRLHAVLHVAQLSQLISGDEGHRLPGPLR